MIKDITIGQFFPGNSPVHKADPRFKLVFTFVYIIITFLSRNFASLAIVAGVLLAIVLLSKISFKMILKSIRPIIILLLVTSLLQLFFNKSGEVLVSFWRFSITDGGLFFAIFTAIRITLLVVASSMLTYTTSPTMLTNAIELLFSPLKHIKVNVHTVAMMMTIALRFIPTLIEEVDKIMSAQKARGADLDSGGLVKRAKAMIPVFVPLFINSFRRAYDLAFAMECRCYTGGEGRTRLNSPKLKTADYVGILLTVLMTAGVIVSNIFISAVI